MADYYVDVGQVGGNGTDPASAWPSVTSGVLVNGDRMWVRRTHTEVLPNSVVPGHFHVADANKSQAAYVIGWPNSFDAFYDARPTAARASWDGDNAATVQANSYAFNAPTLACSGSGSSRGLTLGMGLTLANFFINNIEGAGHTGIKNLGTTTRWRSRLDNVFFVHSSGPHGSRWIQNGATGFRFGKVTWAFSFSSTTQGAFPACTFYADHVVIHSLSIIDAAMFSSDNGANGLYIGLLQIDTNSLAYMFRGATGSDDPQLELIERIIGSEPYSGFDNTADANAKVWAVNDYYGRGPGIFNRAHKVTGYLVASASARHNSKRAWLWDVTSIAAANQDYMGGYQAHRFMRRYITVTSGTDATVRVPVYIGSSNVYSVGMHNTKFHLMAKGCIPKFLCDSFITAGSYDNWAGTLIAGGSCWLYSTTWTPRETGEVPFDVTFGGIIQANSGEGKIGYVLFGEPYV